MKKRHFKVSRRNKRKEHSSLSQNYSVAEASIEERNFFIRRTYLHLAGAIALFFIAEASLLNSGIAQKITNAFDNSSSFLVFIGVIGFILLALFSFFLTKELLTSQNHKTKYFGFVLHILTDAIIFSPFLHTIQSKSGAGVITKTGIITIGLFLGITAVVFLTHQDFSFLSSGLIISGFLMLGFLVAGYIFELWIRSLVIFLLVALAGGWMLFNTSNILHRYRPNQYVVASLTLFTSIRILFSAILRSHSRSQKKY